jgi:hypothetical protein
VDCQRFAADGVKEVAKAAATEVEKETSAR